MDKWNDGLSEVKCIKRMLPIRDALDVISGKWKMMIIVSIMHGNHRFTEIEKSIPKISSKVLAKELKDLEQHLLVKRRVRDDYPVSISYHLTDYANSLEKLMDALYEWGLQHRERVMGGAL